ncbi:hypothetical protein [Psittacicella hinzii]|nr:hypothetical protein [Psittacicella hinzii]
MGSHIYLRELELEWGFTHILAQGELGGFANQGKEQISSLVEA